MILTGEWEIPCPMGEYDFVIADADGRNTNSECHAMYNSECHAM